MAGFFKESHLCVSHCSHCSISVEFVLFVLLFCTNDVVGSW